MTAPGQSDADRAGSREGHTPLLELRGLTRSVRLPSRDMLHILQGVDLTVDAGDHVAVVGRSGSGKTTLLNLLGLIDRQSTGELLFDGRDVSRLSDARRARLRGASIGFVFQQFNLLERRTALENVMMPMMYGTARQFWRRESSAMEMLDRVGLPTAPTSCPPVSPAASSSGWRWPEPWCAGHASSWPTSPPARWMSPPVRR